MQSGKHLEDIIHAYIDFLTYNQLLSSAIETDALSIGFDRDRDRIQRELTNNKIIKVLFHLRIMLKDVFGFAKHRGKATYGLGYKLKITRNRDSSVLNKANAINNAKIKTIASEWYVPHYTPYIPQQLIFSKQILSKIPTELRYVERSIYTKQVNTRNFWTFGLGTQEGINVPIWIIAGFQQRDRHGSENLINDSFYRPPITNAQ